MRIPGRDEPKKVPGYFVAAEDAGRFAEEATSSIEGANGVEWYKYAGNKADRAAFHLCRLRRARSGERGGPQYGDEAVRLALRKASPDALIWIASRAISYMDENGFPEAVEAWFPDDEETTAVTRG
jgi:hypothetical protein